MAPSCGTSAFNSVFVFSQYTINKQSAFLVHHLLSKDRLFFFQLQ